jgi:hypothetical protein
MSITLVDSESRFDDLVASPEAIVFVHFDWSGQSVHSLRLFEEWEKDWAAKPTAGFPQHFRLNPDASSYTWDWLEQEGGRFRSDLGGGGYGSVLWVKFGRVVDFVRYAAKEGKATLTAKTQQAFAQKTPPHPA